MIEVKPPQSIMIPPGAHIRDKRIFLAGSIEMGMAEQWQAAFVQEFVDQKVTIYNPRRDDWDSSWEQSIFNPIFKGQVDWELTAMEFADLIVMYFSPGTLSPITLLELGLYAYKANKLVVCCPEGYWRKGNVDVVCDRYGAQQVQTLDDLILFAKEYVTSHDKNYRSSM